MPELFTSPHRAAVKAMAELPDALLTRTRTRQRGATRFTPIVRAVCFGVTMVVTLALLVSALVPTLFAGILLLLVGLAPVVLTVVAILATGAIEHPASSPGDGTRAHHETEACTCGRHW
jgi:hypothetical protein